MLMTKNTRRNGAAILTIALAAVFASRPAIGASVAIVNGTFYTTDLKNALVASGQTVTEINTYTAASLCLLMPSSNTAMTS